MNFDAIIDEVLEVEGGYSNDPDDLGGETNHGITAAVARQNGYTGSMADMPVSFARKVYTQRYITGPCFHVVADISEQLAAELIDTGINMGPHRAAEFLQRWLNGFNLPGSGYQDLFIDGQIGPITLSALNRYMAKRGKEGEAVLVRAMNCTQGGRYLEITEAKPSQRKFLYGWLRQRVSI